MNTIYEFIDGDFHYKIFDNGIWEKEKTRTKVKTSWAINNFTPIIDQLKAELWLKNSTIEELGNG